MLLVAREDVLLGRVWPLYLPSLTADGEYERRCVGKWLPPQCWSIVAESADADCQASYVTDYDSETIMASRADLIERTLHAQRDLMAGFAIREPDAQIPTNYPLPKYVSCQAWLSRPAIASAH